MPQRSKLTFGANMARAIRTFGLLLMLTSGIILQSVPSHAAAPWKPKVGDCVNYQVADVFLPKAKGTPIKCSGLHNTEIYRISKFKSGQTLSSLSEIELSQIANTACSTWVGTSKFLNQWTFRVPTSAQWKTGARWIRCEALKTKDDPDENGKLQVVSFRGKKLDFK